MLLQNKLLFHLPLPSSPSLPPAAAKPSSGLFLPVSSPLSCNRRKQLCRRRKPRGASYEVGGAYPDEELDTQDRVSGSQREKDGVRLDKAQCDALLKGGEQVTSVLQEMITLLEDVKMNDASEKVAVELVAQGVIGKRVDEMESGFMMALDYMIQLAQRDQDDERKALLEVIKETVLSHLTKKCPPHVQVVGLLCRTPQKDSRHELLRRVAAGGGVFKADNGTQVHIPGANLNDIANQADDLLETMETREVVPDRKLLARLVLIREEARNMMGGGILDERNNRGLSTLPEAEVNFLTKLVALKPGKAVQEMIKNVMTGKDEGADDYPETAPRGIRGRGSFTGRKPLPVRPGMFLETVTKVLGGIYSGNVSGITAQHLEWMQIGLSKDCRVTFPCLHSCTLRLGYFKSMARTFLNPGCSVPLEYSGGEN